MYDIIMQNNASKEFFLLQGLEDEAVTELYIEFNDVDLPEGMPDGEYTYACFVNNREDVNYIFKTPILDTLVQTDDGEIELRYIKPYTGLLRVGEVNEANIYDVSDTNYPYDDGRTDNNEMIYYE